MKKAIRAAWLLSLLCVLVLSALSYGSLPSKIATHFVSRGRPNDWMSTPVLYMVWAVTVTVANVIPLLAAKAASSSLRRRPEKVSIPRKEYWLATPERVVEASGIVSAGAAGIATACNALFVQIFMIIRSYALTSAPRPLSWTFFAPFAALLALAIAYVLGSLYSGNPGDIDSNAPQPTRRSPT